MEVRTPLPAAPLALGTVTAKHRTGQAMGTGTAPRPRDALPKSGRAQGGCPPPGTGCWLSPRASDSAWTNKKVNLVP